MDFVVQKNSALPPETQIREQIKVALLLGNLRPGEILPSLRDLERDLGISRNIVRKAYVELEELGILKLIHGKGVMVNKNLKYKENREFLQECERLVQQSAKRCQAVGVILSSFARFLQHRAAEIEQDHPALLYVDMSSSLAQERADRLTEALQIRVQGVSVDDLKSMKTVLAPEAKIVCNYYRLDAVTKALRGQKDRIVPLRMVYGAEFRNELNGLPLRSRILFIFDEADQSTLGLILEDYRRAFAEREFEFVSQSVRGFASDLGRIAKLKDFARILVSNRIWDRVPPAVRDSSRVKRPEMEFEPSSIEESKIQLGIIA